MPANEMCPPGGTTSARCPVWIIAKTKFQGCPGIPKITRLAPRRRGVVVGNRPQHSRKESLTQGAYQLSLVWHTYILGSGVPPGRSGDIQTAYLLDRKDVVLRLESPERSIYELDDGSFKILCCVWPLSGGYPCYWLDRTRSNFWCFS